MTPTLSLTQSFCASLCIYAVSTGHAFLSLLYLFMLSAFLYASVHPYSVHCALALPTLLSCLTVSCFSGYSSSPPFLSCSCCVCLCALCVFSLTPSPNIPYLFFSVSGCILELKKGDSVLLSVQKKKVRFFQSVFVQGKKLEMNYFSIFYLINVKSNVYQYFLNILIILADFILVFTIVIIYGEKQVKSSILEPKEYIS